MSRRPVVALLTSDGLRHRYVERALAASDGLRLAGVVVERKGDPLGKRENPVSGGDAEDIAAHFAERDRVERELLGDIGPSAPDRLELPVGDLNSPQAAQWVSERAVDLIAMYGTYSLLRDPLLSCFGGRVVNLHLGLSPYYRGAGTNFWPLVDGLPECVGATLHMAVADVDAGPILAQVRPMPSPEDRVHQLGTKAMMAAADVFGHVLGSFASGAVLPVGQDTSAGKVFRRADFDAEALRTVWRRLDDGMIPDYLAHLEERQAAYPIVEVPE